MIVKEIDKIVNHVEIINKMKSKDIKNNNLILDVGAGANITGLYYQLLKKGVKTGIFPISIANVNHLKSEEIDYLDIYSIFPGMKISMDGYEVFDERLIDEVDYMTLKNYQCIIIYDIVSMDPLLREFVAMYFRKFFPKTCVIHIYDTATYVTSDRQMFRLDFRPTYVLNKDLPRLPGVSVSLTYLAHKVRNGKHDKLSVKDTSSEPYSFLSVISRDFIRRFSIQELMNYRNDVDDVPTFVCSNKNLGLFTRLRREQLGYHKITPHEGEELIAYNTFKTCNGEDDIVVRKGTIMTFKKLISGNVMEVVIDNKVHMIVFDKNVFKNVLQTELMSGNRMRLEVDPLVAHVFYAYAVTSSMFDHISCDHVVAFIDGVIPSSYLYSLLKMTKRTITVLLDATIIDTDMLG